jgi:hypothetical protein
VHDVVPLHTRLAPASPAGIDKVRRLADALKTLPQTSFVTEHLLHAGMYTRTVRLPADTMAAAVLIKVPTVLIFQGSARIRSDDELIEVEGYSVLPGSKGRKIAFVTLSKVAMSMIFPTSARTIDEAQREFTDEHELLVPLDRMDEHLVLITGE